MMSYARRALFALLLTSAVVSTVSADEEAPIDVVRIPRKDHAIKAHHAPKDKVSTDDFVVRSPKAGVTHKDIKKHTPEAPEVAAKSAPEHEVRKDKPIDVVRRRISPKKQQQKLEAAQHQPRATGLKQHMPRIEGQVVRTRKPIPAALIQEEEKPALEVDNHGDLAEPEEPNTEDAFEDVELRDKAPAEVVVTRHNNLPHLL